MASGAIADGVDPDTVFPLTTATTGTYAPGSAEALTGFRVDEQSLMDLNGYLDTLPGPAQVSDLDQAAYDRGSKIFRMTSAGGGKCTTCHQADPNKFVPTNIVPMQTLYPGYAAVVIANRTPPLTPIADSSAGAYPFFDNRVVVLDASVRVDSEKPATADAKGHALPMLADLSRKRFLLNDSSVGGADFKEAATVLLNPSRGPMAAHPFYIDNDQDRSDVVEFLRGLHVSTP